MAQLRLPDAGRVPIEGRVVQELLALRDFDRAVLEGRLVGVFDKGTGDHLHVLPCPYVRREHFHEKVVVNGGRNGRYVRYEDIDEALRSLGDKPCKQCFRGIPSLATIAREPAFRRRLEERRSARETPSVQVLSRADSQRASASGGCLVRWRGAAGVVLEAWCSRQLDLDSKAPDPRAETRQLVRARLREFHLRPGQVFHGTYIAPSLERGSDVENPLFTNIDATGSAFASLARHGAAFEFVPEDPSASQGAPPLQHCSVYRFVPSPAKSSRPWEECGTLAEWPRTVIPGLRSMTRSPQIWWHLRQSPFVVQRPRGTLQVFATHMVLHVPQGTEVNAAARIKAVIDAAVLCLCCESGSSPATGIAAVVQLLGQPEAAVHGLLRDCSRAVLGSCAMVDKRGQAQPPDSGCVQGSLVVQEDNSPEWALSGRTVMLARKERRDGLSARG